jgi:hypothetical protein
VRFWEVRTARRLSIVFNHNVRAFLHTSEMSTVRSAAKVYHAHSNVVFYRFYAANELLI